MPTKTAFPPAKVQSLLARARDAACSTPVEIADHLSFDYVDAEKLLAAFACLRLQPGWTLITQQYSDGYNASGFTWALPKGAPQPEPFLTQWQGDPPAHAVDPMTVMTGDGTPWSYLCASLLARELAELGARWHGCDWSTHDLFDGSSIYQLEFSGARPVSFGPTVTQDESGTTVTFYTFSGLGENRVVRHVDTYRPETGYRFTSETETIARAEGGYLF